MALSTQPVLETNNDRPLDGQQKENNTRMNIITN